MSACVEVRQNRDGSWTAAGSYGGVFAQVTCESRYQAVDRVNRAFSIVNPGAAAERRGHLLREVLKYDQAQRQGNGYNLSALLARIHTELGDPS